MDSPALTRPATLLSRLLPGAAIVGDDVRQMLRHWAFWTWLVAGILVAGLWLMAPGTTSVPAPQAAVDANRADESVDPNEDRLRPRSSSRPHREDAAEGALGPRQLSAAEFASGLLRIHLVFFATLVIALSASAIPGESAVAEDAILCRGVARWQYFLGKCLTRGASVFLVTMLLTAPFIGLGAMRLDNDLSPGGVGSAVFSLAGVMAALALLATAGGACFRGALTAVAVMWMVCHGVGITATIVQLTALAPESYVGSLTLILRHGSDAVTSLALPKLAWGTALTALVVSLASYSVRDL